MYSGSLVLPRRFRIGAELAPRWTGRNVRSSAHGRPSGWSAGLRAARHATPAAAVWLAPEPYRDRQLEPRSTVRRRSTARLGTGQRVSRAQAAWGVGSG